MIKKIIVLLIALTSLPVYSANCRAPSVKEYSIYFVNGVLNSPAQVSQSRAALKTLVGMEYKIDYPESYQSSETIYASMLNEIDEVLRQKSGDLQSTKTSAKLAVQWSDYWRNYYGNSNQTDLELKKTFDNVRAKRMRREYVVDEELQELIDKIDADLAEGQKVILVAHSQGNFYANLAWEYFKGKNDGSSERIGIVAVATPASRVADGGPSTTLFQDLAMLAVRLLYPYSTLEANFSGFTWSDLTGHGFVEVYLRPGSEARKRIKGHILDVMGKLKGCTVGCSVGEAKIFDISDATNYAATHTLGDTSGIVQIRFFDAVNSHSQLKAYVDETTPLFVNNGHGTTVHEGSFYWNRVNFETHDIKIEAAVNHNIPVGISSTARYQMTCPGKSFKTPLPVAQAHVEPTVACAAGKASGRANKTRETIMNLGTKPGKVNVVFNDGDWWQKVEIKSVGSGDTLLKINGGDSEGNVRGSFYFDLKDHNWNPNVKIIVYKFGSIWQFEWNIELSCPAGKISQLVPESEKVSVEFQFTPPDNEVQCAFDFYLDGELRSPRGALSDENPFTSQPTKRWLRPLAPKYAEYYELSPGRHSYSVQNLHCVDLNIGEAIDYSWYPIYIDSTGAKILKNGSFIVE